MINPNSPDSGPALTELVRQQDMDRAEIKQLRRRVAKLETENEQLRTDLTESEEGRYAALNLWRMATHGVTKLSDLPSPAWGPRQ